MCVYVYRNVTHETGIKMNDKVIPKKKKITNITVYYCT